MTSSPSKPVTIDVKSVFHVKEGLDETSYAMNSTLQRKSMNTMNNLVADSATQVYASLMPDTFTIADLGCSSGTNFLGMVVDIITSISKVCHKLPSPEYSVLLNDLTTNDFNTVFLGLPTFNYKLKTTTKEENLKVFVSGVPGSFYERLFPTGSVHLICSFSSLHWLSQVPSSLFDERTSTPINKGKIFISSTSPPAVSAAYMNQFKRDFNAFLKSRAAEVVAGGRMVLSLSGRESEAQADRKTTMLWDLLSDSFAHLVSLGLVEEDKVDAYDAPFYAPSVQEIKEEVRREGSFSLDYVQTYEINLSSGDAKKDGRMVSMAVRAVQDSMLTHYFGPEITDRCFHKYTELLTETIGREEAVSVHIGLVLVKLDATV